MKHTRCGGKYVKIPRSEYKSVFKKDFIIYRCNRCGKEITRYRKGKGDN